MSRYITFTQTYTFVYEGPSNCQLKRLNTNTIMADVILYCQLKIKGLVPCRSISYFLIQREVLWEVKLSERIVVRGSIKLLLSCRRYTA